MRAAEAEVVQTEKAQLADDRTTDALAADASFPRTPRQERGQRRVESILNAAAELIAEEGVASVTMHRVARRSGTTTGSMYHFFPDRDTLLGCLAERHAGELRTLMFEIEQDASSWSKLSTDEAVDRLLAPFLEYSERHPDLLPLTRLARGTTWGADRDAKLGPLVVRLTRAVAESRCPDASPAELTLRAVTMAAIMGGIANARAHAQDLPGPTPSDAELRNELRRALVAYLDS